MDLFAQSVVGDLEDVQERIRACRKCTHRKKGRVKRALPGYGATRPILFVVGQYPGQGEDVIGLPMSKHAGKYIRDQFYNRLGLTDGELYWGNTVMCPLPYAPEGETPQLEATQAGKCVPHLESLIDALCPDMIVGLGNIPRARLFAPKHMLGQRKKAQTLIDARFALWVYRGIPMTFVVNPAAVLRKKGPERLLCEEDVEKDFEFLKRVLVERGLI